MESVYGLNKLNLFQCYDVLWSIKQRDLRYGIVMMCVEQSLKFAHVLVLVESQSFPLQVILKPR